MVLLLFQVFFSNMEGPLIELVKKFPYLYDKGDRNFKNDMAKQKAWKNMAELLDTNETVLQGKWRVLRSRYTSLRRLYKDYKPKKKKWEHYDAMKFFDSYLLSRNSYKSRCDQSYTSDFHENGVKIEVSDESEIDFENSGIILSDDPLSINENVQLEEKVKSEKQSENINLSEEEDLFAKQIIMELRKVPNLKGKMFIKREIYNVFYEYFNDKDT